MSGAPQRTAAKGAHLTTAVCAQQVYSSHEGMLLPYEAALTRKVRRRTRVYSRSTLGTLGTPAPIKARHGPL